jgi:gamma-glutamyl-gamma-aminobutyrate hydrolase PuuD
MSPRVVVTKGAGSIDAYVSVLRAVGMEPIELAAGQRIPAFDAVCLSGGPDVEPRRYGQEPHETVKTDPDRDALELDELLPRVWEDGSPILAICRGLQVLNVFRHGSLLQHIGEAHRATGSDVKPHMVVVDPTSRLAAISGSHLVVNSRHHQVIDRLGDGLRSTAWADQYVEAVEAPERPWILGVQWHPERTGEVDPAAVRIFEAFAGAARRVPAR